MPKYKEIKVYYDKSGNPTNPGWVLRYSTDTIYDWDVILDANDPNNSNEAISEAAKLIPMYPAIPAAHTLLIEPTGAL